MLQIKNPHRRILQAIDILTKLGMPKAQQNPRTGLCLLALLNITPHKSFHHSEQTLIGITPIMDFCAKYYHIEYRPNTRETFRRYSMHQLVQAGIVLYNPDNPDRPVNSPKAVYQIAPDVLSLIRTFKTSLWREEYDKYTNRHQSLISTYSKDRTMAQIPVVVNGNRLKLSAGKHNELAKAVIEVFAPSFISGSVLVYVGDTENKSAYVDLKFIEKLNIPYDTHFKLPDIIFYLPTRKWIILVESVTSHGPMNPKRHLELEKLFIDSKAAKVYVTAFPDKATMRRYVADIAWETEVWIADNPTHLIHFNGSKFLGPYVSE